MGTNANQATSPNCGQKCLNTLESLVKTVVRKDPKRLMPKDMKRLLLKIKHVRGKQLEKRNEGIKIIV